jgi:hypothetical protein
MAFQPPVLTNISSSSIEHPIKYEMTDERKIALRKLMAWYWDRGFTLISVSDYEFLYDIYSHGMSFYYDNVKDRLNNIREIYLNDINTNQTMKLLSEII